MTVRFFAQARELTGCAATEMHFTAPVTAGELWDELATRFPALARLRNTARLARNHEYAAGDALFQDDDEAAVIPPVSGG